MGVFNSGIKLWHKKGSCHLFCVSKTNIWSFLTWEGLVGDKFALLFSLRIPTSLTVSASVWDNLWFLAAPSSFLKNKGHLFQDWSGNLSCTPITCRHVGYYSFTTCALMHHSTVDKHREGGRRMKGGVFVFLWCSTPECTQAVLMQSYGGGSWKGISWFQSSNLDLVYMTENLLSECTMWSDEGLCRPKRYHQLNILTLGTRSVQLLLFLTFNSWM